MSPVNAVLHDAFFSETRATLIRAGSGDSVLASGSLYDGIPGALISWASAAGPASEESLWALAWDAVALSLENEPNADVGLLSGQTGALVALFLSARLAGDENRHRRAQVLTSAFCARLVARRFSSDFSTGLAGVVYGLARLGKGFGAPTRDAVAVLAARIAAALRLMPAGRTIPEFIEPAAAPLCGLAHGASGIACSLVTAGDFLQDSGLIGAADDVLAYEDAARRKDGTWPDFRLPKDAANIWRPKSTGLMWCHGLPGIALTRWAMFEVTRRHQFYQRYLELLRRILNESVPRRDLCLCHGMGSILGLLRHAVLHGFDLHESLQRVEGSVAHTCVASNGWKDLVPTSAIAPVSSSIREWGYFSGVGGLVALSSRRATMRYFGEILLPL